MIKEIDSRTSSELLSNQILKTFINTEVDSNSDFTQTLKNFWGNFNKDIDEIHFTGLSASFFHYLKSAFRYDTMSKLDGGIKK